MKRYFACIGFSVAVALLVLNICDAGLALPLTAGSAVLFAASLMLPKYRSEKVFPVCFGSVLFACLLFLAFYYGSVVPSRILGFNEADCAFYITDISENAKGGYTYIAKTKSVLFSGAPQTLKLRINNSAPLYAEPYQLINARLKFYSTGKTSFSSYGCWGKGIYLTAKVKSYEVTDVTVNRFAQLFVNLRSDIINTLYSKIGGDEGALAAALLTGKKSLLSNEAYYAFRTAGVSHIMAVSGLHLSVITGAFMLIFKAIRLNEKISSAVLIAVVISYCALAGFSSSIVRAGIMMCILLLGSFAKRRADLLNSLGAAVFIICLNPFAVSDVGAVLSVLAILSISTAVKAVNVYNEKLRFTLKRRMRKAGWAADVFTYIADSVIVSVCILFYTLPAFYMFFGYFSVICVLINVFIMPLGSLSTVLSLVTYLSNKAGLLSGVFNTAERGVNKLLLYLVRLASDSSVTIIRTELYFGIALAVILALFAVCFFIGKRRLFKTAAVFSLVLLICYSAVSFSLVSKSMQALVTQSGAVAVVSGDKTVVCGIKNKSDYYSVSSFLNIRDGDIDLVIVSDKPEYSVMLAENIKCSKLVSKDFSAELLNSDIEEYEVCDSISGSLGELAYSFDLSGDEPVYGVTAGGFTLTDNINKSDRNTVYVADKTVYDYNGTINLEKGDVLYTFNGNGTLTARRLNIWES